MSDMVDLKSTPAKSSSVVAKQMGKEYVLVPIADNIADMNSLFILNETGMFIWEQIDGKQTIEKIISLAAEHYDIDIPTAKNDVVNFIERIKEFLL